MKATIKYRVSARLLFTLLLSLKTIGEEEGIDFDVLNASVKKKVAAMGERIRPRVMTRQSVDDLLSCVGNAVFNGGKSCYYAKMDTLFPYFYIYHSRFSKGFRDLHGMLTQNLQLFGHLNDREAELFAPYASCEIFNTRVYITYKRMMFALSKQKPPVKKKNEQKNKEVYGAAV